MRFVAGVGLAGELGAGITLVSEMMPKESRGIGTSLVAGIGILGAVAAYLVGDQFRWSTAYLVGGFLGLGLLALRVGVIESGMFEGVLKKKEVARGRFLSLFTSWKRAGRYLGVILIGVPLWFVVGILITFSPEIGKALGMTEVPDAGKAVLFCYVGLAVGDLASGIVSYLVRSRKKAVLGYMAFNLSMMAIYFFAGPFPVKVFYLVCLALGLACGYWALFVTMAAEQFGTNIRATAATSAPNFVRGAVVLLTLSFKTLKPSLGVVASAETVGFGVALLALFAMGFLEETYGKDLDYVEDPLI
jgi:MFS family permease